MRLFFAPFAVKKRKGAKIFRKERKEQRKTSCLHTFVPSC